MAKVTITIDVPDAQLAVIEKEAQELMASWNEPGGKWPTFLELFGMRLVLFELKKVPHGNPSIPNGSHVLMG